MAVPFLSWCSTVRVFSAEASCLLLLWTSKSVLFQILKLGSLHCWEYTHKLGGWGQGFTPANGLFLKSQLKSSWYHRRDFICPHAGGDIVGKASAWRRTGVLCFELLVFPRATMKILIEPRDSHASPNSHTEKKTTKDLWSKSRSSPQEPLTWGKEAKISRMWEVGLRNESCCPPKSSSTFRCYEDRTTEPIWKYFEHFKAQRRFKDLRYYGYLLTVW